MGIREKELELRQQQLELNRKISDLYHCNVKDPRYVDAVKELNLVTLKLQKIQDLRDFILETVDDYGLLPTNKRG